MWRADIKRRGRRSARGVTLIELLISTGLLSVVVAGVYLLYTTMQETLARGEMQSDLQQNARVALDRMTQELRMAGYDPQMALPQVASQKFAEIRAAGTNCLSFETYRKDNTTSPPREVSVQVTYYLNGTSLLRRGQDWDDSAGVKAFSAGTTQPLAEAVNQLAFTYYDGYNRLLTPSLPGGCPPGSAALTNLLDASQAAQVRRIGVSLRTRDSRRGVFDEFYTLTSHVALRNR